jgi:AcrR family transcriptional regulator
MPAPPWRTPRRTAAKPQLSQEVIVDTALRILDREGLDAVSMRRIAEELDTGAASLYAHVANKTELLELAFEQVLGEIKLPEPDPERWQKQVHEVARESLRVLANHADIARVSLASIPVGQNALRIAETMLAIMIGGGVPAQAAAWAVDRISLYINAEAYEGSLFANKLRDSGQAPENYLAGYFGQIADYYRSLPRDRFPHIVDNVELLMAGDGEERFEFGLDMLIRSLATYVPKP